MSIIDSINRNSTGLKIIGNQKERAAEWAASRFPDTTLPPYWGYFTALLVEKDGDILASVIYNNFTSNSLDMHVAAVRSRNWLSRPFLFTVFSYPFVQLNLGRVTAKIGENNHQAHKFLRHLGFTQEGRHPEGWEKGIALLSFGLLKEQCRFLEYPYSGQAKSSRRAGSGHDHSGSDCWQ